MLSQSLTHATQVRSPAPVPSALSPSRRLLQLQPIILTQYCGPNVPAFPAAGCSRRRCCRRQREQQRLCTIMQIHCASLIPTGACGGKARPTQPRPALPCTGGHRHGGPAATEERAAGEGPLRAEGVTACSFFTHMLFLRKLVVSNRRSGWLRRFLSFRLSSPSRPRM